MSLQETPNGADRTADGVIFGGTSMNEPRVIRASRRNASSDKSTEFGSSAHFYLQLVIGALVRALVSI